MKRRFREEDLLFGRIAIDNELAGEEEVKECLFLQKKMQELGLDVPIGEILIQKGYLDREGVELILEVQEKKMSLHRAYFDSKDLLDSEDARSLGRLITRNNILSRVQINDCLEVQRKLREMGIEKRLGEILVDSGLLERSTLESLLRLQDESRTHHPEAAEPGGPLSDKEVIARATAKFRAYVRETERLERSPADDCAGS